MRHHPQESSRRNIVEGGSGLGEAEGAARRIREDGKDGRRTWRRSGTRGFLFFQAEDGIRDLTVTGVQTCALPIYFGLTPTQIKNMDPQGIGVSINVMIPYLKSFAPFVPNDNSVGDGVNFVGYRFKGPEIGRASCRERV